MQAYEAGEAAHLVPNHRVLLDVGQDALEDGQGVSVGHLTETVGELMAEQGAASIREACGERSRATGRS
jgi:hypothetical protein